MDHLPENVMVVPLYLTAPFFVCHAFQITVVYCICGTAACASGRHDLRQSFASGASVTPSRER